MTVSTTLSDAIFCCLTRLDHFHFLFSLSSLKLTPINDSNSFIWWLVMFFFLVMGEFQALNNNTRCWVIEVGKWMERSVEVVVYIYRTQKGSRRLRKRETVYERYCRERFWEASESTFWRTKSKNSRGGALTKNPLVLESFSVITSLVLLFTLMLTSLFWFGAWVLNKVHLNMSKLLWNDIFYYLLRKRDGLSARAGLSLPELMIIAKIPLPNFNLPFCNYFSI